MLIQLSTTSQGSFLFTLPSDVIFPFSHSQTVLILSLGQGHKHYLMDYFLKQGLAV
jgi:hypothetical protein